MQTKENKTNEKNHINKNNKINNVYKDQLLKSIMVEISLALSLSLTLLLLLNHSLQNIVTVFSVCVTFHTHTRTVFCWDISRNVNIRVGNNDSLKEHPSNFYYFFVFFI